MKAKLVRLKKQSRDCLSGEKGMTLSIERMIHELRELKTVIPPDARLPRTDPSLQRYFAEILFNRIDRDLHRVPAEEILLQVSMVVDTYGYTGFDLLRRYLPFPNESTLHHHYASVIEEEQTNLSDIRGIDSILVRHEGIEYTTIAVGAISLDIVFLSDRKDLTGPPQPAYAFVYHWLPLTTLDRCFSLHVMPGMSGNVIQAQTRRAEDIVNILTGAPHRAGVMFIATDGDGNHDSMYHRQFPHWFPAYHRHGLVACLDVITRIYPLYVGDWLHRTQNIRARMLKHTPVLRFQGRQSNVLQGAMNNTVSHIRW
jgi:hypothetical protein